MIAYLLDTTFDVQPLVNALDTHPELWNARVSRTAAATSPHHGLDDIWARYAPDGTVVYSDAPHASEWNYDVCAKLPIKQLAEEVLKVFPGKLGGVLITKIGPGKLCKPHTDTGWHAKYYDKIAVSIKANDQQAFCFDDLFIITQPGEAFWFDNSYTHWVPNVSVEDRITAIFCIRPESKGE